MSGRSARSRARSATPPEKVVFVIDENLGGVQVRDALEKAGATVKLVKEEFGEGAQDVDWLPEVGKRGWIVLTKDKRIRRNAVERGAFVAARVQGFFLTARGLSGPDVAALFRDSLSRMQRIVERYEAPFIAIVRRAGIEM